MNKGCDHIIGEAEQMICNTANSFKIRFLVYKKQHTPGLTKNRKYFLTTAHCVGRNYGRNKNG